jgi:CheY-like chemotaxis protein
MQTQALLLVAEDDPDDQFFFQEAVNVVCPQGVEVHFFLDGAQLLKCLQSSARNPQSRNLVVLDLNMRVKDGRSTLRELKADPAFTDIPVAVLTTSDSVEDIEYCKSWGAVGYFCKPGSIVELVKIVRNLYQDYLN